MHCEHYINDGCKIVGNIVGVKAVPVDFKACQACMKCNKPGQQPKTYNYVTASLAIGWVRKNDKDRVLSIQNQYGHFLGRSPTAEDIRLRIYNCGDYLKEMIHKLGFDYSEDCPCKDWVDKMNLHGPEWAEAQINNIAKSMLEEAKKRKIESIFTKAGMLLAITKTSNTTALFGAQSLIRKAIELCREEPTKYLEHKFSKATIALFELLRSFNTNNSNYMNSILFELKDYTIEDFDKKFDKVVESVLIHMPKEIKERWTDPESKVKNIIVAACDLADGADKNEVMLRLSLS